MKKLLILSILCGALASGAMAKDTKSGVFVDVELGGGITVAVVVEVNNGYL